MATKTLSASEIERDDSYTQFEQLIRDRVSDVKGPVFETDACPETMWREWLLAIPYTKRTHYTCHACRTFIQKYGGLVALDPDERHWSVLWQLENTPQFFLGPANMLLTMVESSARKVTGPFIWGEKEKVWGTPQTGSWTHMCGVPARPFFSNPLRTPHQEMAVKKEDYGVLCRSLADYPAVVVTQALRVLDAGAVYRSEKALGVAKWFDALHKRLEGLKGNRRSNVIWLAVAEAPVGFCHVRSTVISTLLDDVKVGMDFDAISRRWAQKLNPLQYQRPTAPPTTGAIKQAEEVFEKMGAARSLERRFARLEDVQSWLWKPAPEGTFESSTGKGGLFDHLRQDKKPVQELDLPAKPITMEKFRKEVLPTALQIEVQISSVGPFYGLVTAVHTDAPSILQWDGLPDRERNPVSYYFWYQGSPATQWGLRAGWVDVTCLFDAPHQWQCPGLFTNQGQTCFFVLKGCRESRVQGLGSALFPEILKSEFHPVRSVIEAHSKKATLAGAQEGDANGIAFQKGSNQTLTVRVRSGGGRATYRIDRWD